MSTKSKTMSKNTKLFCQISVALVIGFIIWEHTARINETTIRPTTGIFWVANKMGEGAHYIGYLWGVVGSWFYNLKYIFEYLYLDKLFYETIPELVRSLFNLIYVPIREFCKGYYDLMMEYYVTKVNPWYIIYGSGIIIIAILGILYYFKLYKKIPKLKDSNLAKFLDDFPLKQYKYQPKLQKDHPQDQNEKNE